MGDRKEKKKKKRENTNKTVKIEFRIRRTAICSFFSPPYRFRSDSRNYVFHCIPVRQKRRRDTAIGLARFTTTIVMIISLSSKYYTSDLVVNRYAVFTVRSPTPPSRAHVHNITRRRRRRRKKELFVVVVVSGLGASGRPSGDDGTRSMIILYYITIIIL